LNVNNPHIKCENELGMRKKILSKIEIKIEIINILDGLEGSNKILTVNITNY
jgi:hypothetical protein